MKAPAGDWRGLLVVVGTSFWDGVPLLERHLAAELTRYGPVLYVDPPVSFLTRFRNRDAARAAKSPGLRKVDENLAVLSVRVPPLQSHPRFSSVTHQTLRWGVRRAVEALRAGRPKVVIVPSLEPMLGFLGEEHSVYYVKDDYVAGAELVGYGREQARRQHVTRIAEADLVVVVSDVLLEALRRDGVDAVLIPNACVPEIFADVPLPQPDAGTAARVAYVGQLSDRVDVTYLEAVVRRGIRVRLIGSRPEIAAAGAFDRLLASSLVEWVGPVPHREVPALLADISTCVLPYADSAFNRASFPLKVLEYLAAGRRVVSTDLPAVRWLDTDLITIAATPESFARAVAGSVASPISEPEVRNRRELASQHSWRVRADRLAELLELTPLSG